MSNFPRYDTKLFCEIYGDVTEFIKDYKNQSSPDFINGIPATISDNNAQMTYYLLYSKYGNSPIANFDVNQFKYKLFTIIWQYGPAWEKRLSIQSDLRNLSASDMRIGTKTEFASEGETSTTDEGSDDVINNHAYNPSTEPATDAETPLNYIDQQNYAKGTNTREISGSDSKNTTQNVTKSKMDAYEQLWELIKTDVTSEYIDKFKRCFKQFVSPEQHFIYVTEVEEDED